MLLNEIDEKCPYLGGQRERGNYLNWIWDRFNEKSSVHCFTSSAILNFHRL